MISREQTGHHLAAVPAAEAEILLLGCKKLVGRKLKNHRGELLGFLNSIVVDLKTGRISYVVLTHPVSFVLPPKLFAIPWHALVLEPDETTFSIEVERPELRHKAGFDPAVWPAGPDPSWQRKVDGFYCSD